MLSFVKLDWNNKKVGDFVKKAIKIRLSWPHAWSDDKGQWQDEEDEGGDRVDVQLRVRPTHLHIAVDDDNDQWWWCSQELW